jgi:hypothetical protein
MFDLDRLIMLERSQHNDFKDRPLLITPDSVQDEILKYASVRLAETSFF